MSQNLTFFDNSRRWTYQLDMFLLFCTQNGTQGMPKGDNLLKLEHSPTLRIPSLSLSLKLIYHNKPCISKSMKEDHLCLY